MTRTSLFTRLWPALLTLALVSACHEPDAPSSSNAPPLAVSPENARAPFDLGSVVRRVHFAYRPGEDGWTSGHSTYSVRVDARGLTVTPYHQPGGPGTELPPEPGHRAPESRLVVSGAPATFGPALITRGTTRWEMATGPGQVREDGSLSLPRGEVEERLRNDEEGIEQSWHFARAPGGQGELVVRLPVHGLGFAGETARGLHFTDSRTGLGFRYGHATWTDASGRRTELRARYTAGAIELRVPAEQLSASAFPAALTPKVSPEIALDTPVTAPGGGSQEKPAIAFDGKNYLVVWADSRGGYEWDIFGTRVSPEGVVLDSLGIPISMAGNWQQAPSVDFNGKDYLVVWQDARSNDGNIHIFGTRVSPDGVVLERTGIPVTTPGPTTGVQMVNPVVSHDRSRTFMVVWEQRGGGAVDIHGARVNELGTVLDKTPLRIASDPGEERAPAIAFDGNAYLVVWELYRSSASTGFDIYGIQLSTGGWTYTSSALPISTSTGGQSDPAVAFDGYNFLVVWEDSRTITSPSGTGTNIFGARVSTGGSVYDTSGFPVIVQAGGQYDPAIAVLSGEALVTWGEQNGTAIDIQGVRLSSSGSVKDFYPLQLSTAANTQHYPAIASNGVNEYFVVWEDGRTSSNWDIYGTKVSYWGATSHPDGVHLSPAPNSETTPVVASDGTNYLVVFTDNRSGYGSAIGVPDNWDLYGVRVGPTGTVLDPSGFAICTRIGRQRLPAVAFGGSNYLVAWEDNGNFSGNGTDIYAARVSLAGKLLDTNAISLSAWTGNESSPAIAFDGTNYLVVWTDASTSTNNNIFGNRVGQDGRTLDHPGFLISKDSFPDQRVPTVSWDGTNYLVVWHQSSNGSPFRLYGARVTPGSSVLDSSGFLISSSPNPVRYVSAAFDGTNHLVVWNDTRSGNADVYAARVSKTGMVLDPSGLPIATGIAAQQRGSVAYNGTDFVVVWQEQRHGTNWDIYSTRVNGAGQVLDGTGLAISTGVDDEVNPSVGAIAGQPWLVAYQVADHSSGSFIQRIRARTVSLNAPPTANPRSDTLDEDTPTPITLSASDPEGQPLSYTVVTQPAYGTLSGTAPDLTYTPARDYHGLDSFTFTASDGQDSSVPATVSLTINPVNDAPVAHAQSVSTPQDTAVSVTLTGSDAEGDTPGFAVDSGPSHGTLTGTPPHLTYTPAAGFYGTDSFTFTVSDALATSTPATVSLTVISSNQAPVASAQSYSLPEDTSLTVKLAGSDAEGDTLTFAVASGPSHGTLTGTAPDLTYTPAPDFHGTDSFTFTASDAQATSAPATVSFTVTPKNDAPVASAQSRSTPEDTAVSVTLTGSDVDGDSLTFNIAHGPSHGSLSGTAPHLTYTPAAHFHGTDSFTFTVSDAQDTSAPATVSLTITPVNDAPVASSQPVTTPEDTAVSVTLSGFDVEGDSLTFAVAQGPSHGTLSGTAPHLTYTPAADFHGSDSFTFTVSDAQATSAPATVSLTMTTGNDAPVAHAQSRSTSEDTAVSVTLTGSDVDGDSLTFTVAQGPSHGTLSGTAPDLTYTPAADFHGSDSFTFTVHDGKTASASATVSLSVSPGNDEPVVQAQSLSVRPGHPLAITLTGSDVDGDALTFAVTSTPSPGTLTGVPPDLVYTAPKDFRGTVQLAFTAHDGQATSAPATIAISVSKQALMVNAVADSRHPRAGQPVRFHANVVHSDGQPVQLRWHFGDGESSTEELPLHAFASPGTYEVRLIATSGSTEATASLRLAVRDPEGIAIPGGAPDKPIDVDEGTSVTLVATEPLRPGTTVVWDFGDGTELAAGNPVSHTYADDGHYVLRMSLLEESGHRSTVTRPVTVHNLPPVPMPQDELSVLPGVPIALQLAASDSAGASDPLQWELISGEGTVDADGRFSWTPPSAGLHTVEVKVSDDEEGASFLAFQLRVNERGVHVPAPSSGFGCGAGSSGVTAPLGLGLLLLALRGRRRSRT